MNSHNVDPQIEVALLEQLQGIAREYVDQDDSLVLLDIDPENYPAQASLSISGNPQSLDFIDGAAQVADTNYGLLQEAAFSSPRSVEIVDQVCEELENGKSIVLVTNHAKLIDIAVAEAVLFTRLARQGVTPKTAIIISKVVSMIGVKFGEDPIPAADALTWLCDDIYLSIPRTKAVEDAHLDSKLKVAAQIHNSEISDRIGRLLSEGGVLLGAAASGHVDHRNQGRNITLETISNGTSRIMSGGEATLVLPVAIWSDTKSGTVLFDFVDGPRKVDVDSAHDVMGKIAMSLTNGVEGISFDYSSAR